MDKTLTSTPISGTITVPASKSQTIRALLVATFAKGRSVIHNPLDSQDTRSCIEVCRAFGATIVPDVSTEGLTSLTVDAPITFPASITVDCGNSGTTLYLAAGMAAATGSAVTFTGDAQLRNRPVGELLQALSDLGVTVDYPSSNSRPGYPPFTITGPITGGSTSITCHTSQHLSALLLGCPLGIGTSRISVPLLNERPYVHMTRSWLDSQHITYEASESMDTFTITGNQRYTPFESVVNGDYSSASFFFCAAAVAGGCVTVAGLDPKDPQGDKEILAILQSMGCSVTWNERNAVTVCGPGNGKLVGGQFDLNAIPDALPILAVTACFAHGTTVLGNVPQARIKETDRIAVMHENLASCGAEVEEHEDALIIHGRGKLLGGTCDGYDDHRIIMAMAIASLGAIESVTIKGIDAVGVTFPTFFSLLEQISEHHEENQL
ncbi:MAG TPA: 3-phosphoshikimate 1-carboxyvinyltransferase [Sphaerochaeta sp.]|nr:3-phosphoshikimate 1-carboxyvinyltransferase [Sphaerochaeta sp.]